MSNVRVFYNPPPGSPPFVFEELSTDRVIQPPDKYWMRGFEQHRATNVRPDNKGIQRDELTGEPITFMATRSIYVPDDEKNAKMAAGEVPPPLNYMDLDAGSYRQAIKASHGYKHPVTKKPLHTYLITEEMVEGEHRRRLDELKGAQDKELMRLMEEHALKKRQMMQQIADMDRTIEGGKAPAPEKPVDVNKRSKP